MILWQYVVTGHVLPLHKSTRIWFVSVLHFESSCLSWEIYQRFACRLASRLMPRLIMWKTLTHPCKATKIPLLWGTSNLKMSGFTWLSWCSQLQMLFCFCQKPQFSISLQNHNGMIPFLSCIPIFVPIWYVIMYYCQSIKLCSKLIDFMINVNIVCTLESGNRCRAGNKHKA